MQNIFNPRIWNLKAVSLKDIAELNFKVVLLLRQYYGALFDDLSMLVLSFFRIILPFFEANIAFFYDM